MFTKYNTITAISTDSRLTKSLHKNYQCYIFKNSTFFDSIPFSVINITSATMSCFLERQVKYHSDFSVQDIFHAFLVTWIHTFPHIIIYSTLVLKAACSYWLYRRWLSARRLDILDRTKKLSRDLVQELLWYSKFSAQSVLFLTPWVYTRTRFLCQNCKE